MKRSFGDRPATRSDDCRIPLPALVKDVRMLHLVGKGHASPEFRSPAERDDLVVVEIRKPAFFQLSDGGHGHVTRRMRGQILLQPSSLTKWASRIPSSRR
jgi:hypothetical protein